jgi:hypothetical protein
MRGLVLFSPPYVQGTWWCSWLRYRPGGRGFDSLEFFIYYGLGVVSASNRNGYLGYLLGGNGGQCLRLKNLSPSCAYFLEILAASPPALKVCPGLYKDILYIYFTPQNIQSVYTNAGACSYAFCRTYAVMACAVTSLPSVLQYDQEEIHCCFS